MLGGHQILTSNESVRELIEATALIDPELVVLAESLEPFTRLGELRLLREQRPIPLVLVAGGPVAKWARRRLNTDIEGLVLEAEIEQALAATVDAVLAEQLCVPETLRDALAQPIFSHREKQVLSLVLDGLTNGEIAARMYLSESTVKSHLASSFRKLGVSSRAEAAQRVLEPASGLDFVRPSPAADSPFDSTPA